MTRDELKQEIKDLFARFGAKGDVTFEDAEIINNGLDELLNTDAWRLPQGWKLVPIEPTVEMLREGMEAYWKFGTPLTRYGNIYKAFLEHAPSYQLVNIDLQFWHQIVEASQRATWMPPDYHMNDWVSDVCTWLEKSGKIS